MLAEMQRFLQVHAGKSEKATAVEALYRSTRASADLLELAGQFGRLEAGFPMSFIEVESPSLTAQISAETAIRSLLPIDPDHPARAVRRVTTAGSVAFSKAADA
jgi:hypothetical protein